MSNTPCEVEMPHHHHKALDLLCGAAGVQPHPDDHSRLPDAVEWHHPESGEMHRHHFPKGTCTQPDAHCDWHSAETNNISIQILIM